MSARRFDGKVALVTGGSRGAGREICEALAREGAAVGVTGRDQAALAETVASITAAGGSAVPIVADVGSDSDVRDAVAAIVSQLGGLDLLVNAAGALRTGPVSALGEDDWNVLFDTNAKGVYLCSKHALAPMKERGGGAIVNVSSVFALAADRGSAAYSASKAAVLAFTRIMALETIADGIRVNAVAPGTMPTPMVLGIAARSSPDDPQIVLDAIDRLHPLGRMIEPAELAAVVLFLLSDEASAIVGSTFVVDGGRHAKLGSG